MCVSVQTQEDTKGESTVFACCLKCPSVCECFGCVRLNALKTVPNWVLSCIFLRWNGLKSLEWVNWQGKTCTNDELSLYDCSVLQLICESHVCRTVVLILILNLWGFDFCIDSFENCVIGFRKWLLASVNNCKILMLVTHQCICQTN